MTREEINLLTSDDLEYIASIPNYNQSKVNYFSHIFLYKTSLIKVETVNNNKVNHIFITNHNMETTYIFSNSKIEYYYTFEEDCARYNINDVKDFLFEILLLIKIITINIDTDGSKVNHFFKKIIRKEKIRKILSEDNN